MPDHGLPEYLRHPPDSAGSVLPPVRTAPQLLDFLGIGWDNFERLCLRLAPDGRDVHHQLYGNRGQNQQGIDLYVRLDGQNGYSPTSASACRPLTRASSQRL
jgi:hypothetical protein